MLLNDLIAFFSTLPHPHTILVGVSGGADSIALVRLLHQHRNALDIPRLAIAHVNHGLRGEESDGDEEFVRQTACELGLEFFCTNLDGLEASDRRDGVEEWARRHRYEFFRETAKNANISYTATAHTADDQAETLILRLARGTGVRGLRGILPAREDGVIRPLIRTARANLTEWLTEHGHTWRTDSSNADTAFRRNYTRAEIIPRLTALNPAAIQNIAACAESAARVWNIAAQRVNEWTEKYALRVSPEIFHVYKAGLAGNEGDNTNIAREALLTLFDEHGITPSRQHIERVIAAAATTADGKEYLLPDGWRFYPREDRVCFCKPVS